MCVVSLESPLRCRWCLLLRGRILLGVSSSPCSFLRRIRPFVVASIVTCCVGLYASLSSLPFSFSLASVTVLCRFSLRVEFFLSSSSKPCSIALFTGFLELSLASCWDSWPFLVARGFFAYRRPGSWVLVLGFLLVFSKLCDSFMLPVLGLVNVAIGVAYALSGFGCGPLGPLWFFWGFPALVNVFFVGLGVCILCGPLNVRGTVLTVYSVSAGFRAI